MTNLNPNVRFINTITCESLDDVRLDRFIPTGVGNINPVGAAPVAARFVTTGGGNM